MSSKKPAPASLIYVTFSAAQLSVLLQAAKASNCTIAQLVTAATCAHLAACKGYAVREWEHHITNDLQDYAHDGDAPEAAFDRWEKLKKSNPKQFAEIEAIAKREYSGTAKRRRSK